MSVHYYPVAVKLKNKIAVVVGGGAVSERKIKTLLKAGAHIRAVSPALSAFLSRLAKARKITWLRKEFSIKDLRNADIIIAATSDPDVNKRVSVWAGTHKVPVNIVDSPDLSDFISPAVFRKEKAIIAVYTDGRDPVLSRDLKNFLKGHWDVFLSYRDKL